MERDLPQRGNERQTYGKVGYSSFRCHFFCKPRHISRYYRQYSKQIAKEHKREELYARANLEITMAWLHDDTYNEEKQGEANKYKRIIEEIESRKAKGSTIRSRVM